MDEMHSGRSFPDADVSRIDRYFVNSESIGAISGNTWVVSLESVPHLTLVDTLSDHLAVRKRRHGVSHPRRGERHKIEKLHVAKVVRRDEYLEGQRGVVVHVVKETRTEMSSHRECVKDKKKLDLQVGEIAERAEESTSIGSGTLLRSPHGEAGEGWSRARFVLSGSC